MKIKESFNDTHLIDVKLSLNDLHQLKKGAIFYVDCPKSDTEIFISIKKEKTNG